MEEAPDLNGRSPPKTLMAELGQYDNYPTYPGMGTWTPTTYERNLSKDYAISETNVPSESIATRLDILSGEYPVGAWIGPVIPLPSALLVGYNYTTILDMRGRYWNWLSTGQYLLTTSNTASGYSSFRPATFHYQLNDIYKESVHYGFDLMLLAFVMSTGSVFVTNIVSFIPFLEHRHQCSFKRFVLQYGTVSSSVVSISSLTVKINPLLDQNSTMGASDIGTLNIKCYWKSTDASTGKPVVNNRVFPVKSISSDVGIIADVSEFKSEVESGLFPDLAGSFFILDRPLQMEDPKTAYTETIFGREYIVSSNFGYTTREQAIEATSSSWTSVYYDAALISSYLEAQAKVEEEKASSSKDTQVVAESNGKAAKYKSEAKAVLTNEPVYDGKSIAVKGASVSVDGVEIVVSDVVLRVMKELGASNVSISLEITSTTLSRHNFGQGTQVGNHVLFTKTGQLEFSAYKVVAHERSGVFTLSTESASSMDSLYDSLSVDGSFRILSGKLWKISDICTNKSGISAPTNTSLDRGLFDVQVESAYAKRIDDTGKISEDDKIPLRVVLKCKFTDRNYYTLDYLRERFLNDLPTDASSTVVRGWKKYNGWRFNRQGNESTKSFSIIGITENRDGIDSSDSGYLYISLDVEAIEEPSVDEYGGNWWISFDDLHPCRSPFNYIATPFLGLNAFLTDIGTNAKIMFDGIYVGSPLSMSVPRNASIRLIEDNPVLFPNISGVDFSLIKVSTAKAYRYVAYMNDDLDEAEYILYERYDDASKAMFIRKGRLGFLNDMNEFLIHHDAGTTDVVATVSGDGSTTQTISVPPLSINNKDVVSIVVRKAMPDRHPVDDKGEYRNTLWRMYQSDRLLGIESTSGKENTIFTRAAGKNTVSGVEDIPFYSNAEYFSGGREVEYRIAGNNSSDDPLAGDGSRYRFVPVLNMDRENSKFASAIVKTVPSEKVVRNAFSRHVFPVNGKAVICVEQPVISYLPSDSSMIDEVRIVPGTESKRESENILPPVGYADIEQNGAFILNSTDSFGSFSSGYFFRRGTGDVLDKTTMWRYPFLAVPNINQCAFSKCGKDIDVVGYSVVENESGDGILAIVHSQVNMINSFGRPVYAFYSKGTPVLLSSSVSLSRNIVIGDGAIEGVDPFVVVEGLSVHPLSIASSGKYKFIVFRTGTVLAWALSSSDGSSWSFYNDISLTPSNYVSSSPSLVVWGDWLLMCYIKDKIELRMKKISIPSLVKFHSRYNSNVVSSTDPSAAARKLREELQVELNNTFDVKITDTFDQQVSFQIGKSGLMRVVFFDNKGLVNAATSTTEGVDWNLSPVNF